MSVKQQKLQKIVENEDGTFDFVYFYFPINLINIYSLINNSVLQVFFLYTLGCYLRTYYILSN